MNATIRPMETADVESIAELLALLANEFILHEFPDDAKAAFLRKNNARRIQAFVERGYRYHVAELDGRLIGFVGVRDNKHLYHLFVANDFQRQGVGTALWNVARAECIVTGNPGEFTVNASNNAVAMYERLGFVRVAPTQNNDGVAFNPMVATNVD